MGGGGRGEPGPLRLHQAADHAHHAHAGLAGGNSCRTSNIFSPPLPSLKMKYVHGRIFEQHEYNFSEGEGKKMFMFLATIKYLWYIPDPVEPEPCRKKNILQV